MGDFLGLASAKHVLSTLFSGQLEANMFDHQGSLGEGHVDAIKSAIADGRAGFNTQAVRPVAASDGVFYQECLATIQGVDGILYGAGSFIPQLEASGHISLLDQNMLRLVLSELDRDRDAVFGCNISADNLSDRAAWHGISGQIRSRPDLASRLILELTETRPLSDMASTSAMLAEVREVGCKIALDDFGTGYASPALVRLLDFDIVKIDRSFLDPIGPSTFYDESLAHFINFASCYSPIIVMEGIETVEQAQLAALSGATHLQGYGISRPLPAGQRMHAAERPYCEKTLGDHAGGLSQVWPQRVTADRFF
ncbi:EAL domain-containing protein [Agrobacterium tumefaciens]|uniref:EAL domain-containing protein n=1 Tax=Agrobacterium tumefaciens TaxID=358 RepID=UPI0021CFE771|nr:EAL domain-containing protein [Agrobacterium tumefaciens]UXS05402.1 EAL domain-containing protein [Agrobacterium tumefaciens]